MSKKKSAYIIRNFRNAGTGQFFTKGSIVEIDEGEFANHEVAGLVRAPTSEDRAAPKSTEPAKVKTEA